ncbi:MAG: hypothetical protein KatS3mg068_2594 [Candidatus Sericytochromatia bacterium]|nr:MAG: hypothetical protein KatS3mg068_2594 [Candidatus Sericytochromatia bacterium]
MIYDIFFSICQTEVDGYIPSERQMFLNFFDQVKLADKLGFKTAWVAETHLSSQVQKTNKNPVIPDFKGEIGLNTDILQLAHKIFSVTKNINVGSAIKNILCNGGPLAHAEAIKTFLTLHSLNENEKRLIEIGFASGRFEFSNRPYGIYPRNYLEELVWKILKGKIFLQATEIFLRGLRGDIFSSDDLEKQYITKEDFRTEEEYNNFIKIYGKDKFEVESFWKFEKVGIIPFEAPLDLLRLTIGSHDKKAQIFANKFLPCGVFNLSITPDKEIEETHERMKKYYNNSKNNWNRALMPRTVLIFTSNNKTLSLDSNRKIASEKANKAIANYWKAMEGTLDIEKVNKAVNNALVGTIEDIKEQIESRFNKDDRLMLWFDFNNHNNEEVKQNIIDFSKIIS